MNDYTNLNKRDLHYYKLFLKQSKNGYQNELLDNSFKIINSFILKKYNSNDFKTSSLEDFIQECFAIIIEYNTIISTTMISRVYNNLRNTDNRQSEKELVSLEEYSIDYERIYFKMLMKDIIPQLKKEIYQDILTKILDNNDLSIDNMEFGLSRQRISQIKDEIYIRLKWNKDFIKYYSDYIYETNNYYEQMLKKYTIKEFIYNPKSYYKKNIMLLIKKYYDNPNELSIEELKELLNVLLYIRNDYYKYHEEEIHTEIKKVSQLIFYKSI